MNFFIRIEKIYEMSIVFLQLYLKKRIIKTKIILFINFRSQILLCFQY